MTFSRQSAEMAARVAGLLFTLIALSWALTRGGLFLTSVFLAAAAVYQTFLMVRRNHATDRKLARFLDALAFDDAIQHHPRPAPGSPSSEFDEAISRAMDRLHRHRIEGEEQIRYLQALLFHVPVPLIARDMQGCIEILNPAAYRLFGTAIANVADLAEFGETFARGVATLVPGDNELLRIERPQGSFHLKVAAAEFSTCRRRQTIISLQNIDSELSERELAAWQMVLRTMTHEVMNSLTPISSLSVTAGKIVHKVRDRLPPDTVDACALDDAVAALDTVARRSNGLTRFVQDHHRLTQCLSVRRERLALLSACDRLHTLLAPDFDEMGISMAVHVEPESLEISADGDLIDQALINLLRNAIEALKGRPGGAVSLSATRQADGHVVVSVADNGPGIPSDQRDKVFVPFYTTKRQGTGVGLTFVRQIAGGHGASISISETPGGGATVSLRF